MAGLDIVYLLTGLLQFMLLYVWQVDATLMLLNTAEKRMDAFRKRGKRSYFKIMRDLELKKDEQG